MTEYLESLARVLAGVTWPPCGRVISFASSRSMAGLGLYEPISRAPIGGPASRLSAVTRPGNPRLEWAHLSVVPPQ
jgi:hypothetical protein